MTKNELINSNFWNNTSSVYKIIGPAGSGKTYTLKEFVKNNKNKRGLIITYTNNAVYEIKRRVVQKIEVHTIHSWIWNFLKNSQNLLISAYTENNFKYSGKKIKKIIYDLGYNYYDESSNELNISHNDIINLFVKLLQNKNQKIFKILDTYDYFIIDEFQDTNNEILSLLCEYKWNNMKLLLFGDLMQQIYDDKEMNIPNSENIYLETNYRSNKNITEFVHSFRQDKDDFMVKSNSKENGLIKILKNKEKFKELSHDKDIFTLQLQKNLLFKSKSLNNIKRNVNYFNEKYSYPKEDKLTNKKESERDEITNFILSIISLQNNNISQYTFVKKYLKSNISYMTKEKILNLKNVIQCFYKCKSIREVYSLKKYIKSSLILEELKKIYLEIQNNKYNVWEFYIELYEYIYGKKSTMHSSKGLEYTDVLISLESTWNKYDFQKIFELGSKENKLFYVSISRAKRNLFIYTDNDKIYDQLMRTVKKITVN